MFDQFKARQPTDIRKITNLAALLLKDTKLAPLSPTKKVYSKHSISSLIFLNVISLDVRGPGSKWEQVCHFNDLREHRIDMMIVTESKLDNLQTFSKLLNGYEKIMSPY